MRDLAEEAETLIDLFTCCIFEAFRTESLDGKGSHHTAIKQCRAEDPRVSFGCDAM